MPLISIVAFFLILGSLAVLGFAAWLLGDWYLGETLWVEGERLFHREDWRLWLGLALLAWSFAGRWMVLLLAAKPDRKAADLRRRDSAAIEGATGEKLHVESSGRGPALVLTHGWGMDATIWNSLVDRLSGDHRLITWDLPGLGRSEIDHRQFSLETMAADLRRVVAHAGEPVVLVGHSIGGMIIQTLARDHRELFGERIKAVVLFNTTHTNPLRTMILSRLARALQKPVLEPLFRLMIFLKPLVWLGAWQGYLSGSSHLAHRLGFGPDVTRSQLEHATKLSTRNPPDVLARGNLAMFRWDATNALSGLPCPVLVIGGDVDIVTKCEAGQQIATSAAGDFTVVPRANHMGFLEQQDVYENTLRAFLRRHAEQPAS
ncbi:MAG TPA: alpha/beta hydrolase [Brevundimonas sp.]|uniref:alpha/beta fold hydrolase n=1 Tax=Brevundimonas sp. TaxID=1871086 RepID=UPI002EDA69EB